MASLFLIPGLLPEDGHVFSAFLVLDLQKNSCVEATRPRCVATIPAVRAFLDLCRGRGVFVAHSLTSTAVPEDIVPEKSSSRLSASSISPLILPAGKVYILSMKKNSFNLTFLLIASLVLSLFPGCGAASRQAKPGAAAAPEVKGPVTVATMIDSEGAVLGKMLLLLLEAEGFTTVDKTEFGTPDILRKALEAKEVDLVIDYTGSGQYYHEGFDPTVWSDPVKGYEMTRRLDRERKNLQWLTPAPANNTEMLAVKRDFAAANGIVDMESFAAYVNKGGKVKLICAQSFADNKLGLLGYEDAYGFKLEKDQLILLSSGNTAEMLKALYEGIDGVNVSLVYGTDGALDKMNLLALKDTKNVPPVYLPAPVLRGELAEKYPVLETLFTPLFESLTLETLQKLNAGVAFDGRPAEAVARDYLASGGFLKK